MRKTQCIPLRFAVSVGVMLAVVSASVGAAEVKSASLIHLGRIKATEADRRAKLNEAEALYAKGKYSEARDAVSQVAAALRQDQEKINAEVLKSLEKAAKRLDFEISRDWGKQIFRTAQIAAGDERFEDAIALAGQAQGIDPALKDKVNDLISFCRKQMTNREQRKVLAVDGFAPEVKKGQKDVRQLLLAAEVFINNKEPMEALRRIEQVFIIDPTNAAAIEKADRIYSMLYAYAEGRRKADNDSIVTGGTWQWVEPVFPAITGKANPTEHGSVKGADNQQMLSRMDNIIFPQVEFDGAAVGVVLDWVSRRSVVFDAEKRGVVINKNLPAGSESLNVSLSLKNIPMSEVIRYICQQTNMKYRVDGDVVTIGPEINEMISRRFSAPSSLIGYVAGESGDSGEAASADSESEDGATSKGADGNAVVTVSKGAAVTEAQWKNYFEKRGVKFPQGSTVHYIKAAKMLTVYNTPENLNQLDVLLRQLEMVGNPPLIMVEIKSIEVAENDYQELGFEWSLGNCGTKGTDSYFGSSLTMDANGNTSVDAGEKFGWLIGQGINTLAGGFVRTIRGGNTTTESPASAIVNNWNIFPTLFGSSHPFGSDLPLNISLTINAMDQNERTETLSAPKVITSNDVEASVKLGKTYYFPESWDELEVEVDTSDDNSVTTITPPVPDFPEEGTEIGIKFSVKPRVLPDNRTIRMHLAPAISIYEGDDEWPISLKYERLTQNGWEPAPDRNITYVISKPIIAKREMDMTVDLDNGETVVLGGLVHSETVARVDKIPLLCDLPLIGRLFQNSAENARRTNLLFFVTARLISYDGVPIERDNIPGVPDFNR